MFLVRLAAVACLISGPIVSLGCQQSADQEGGKMDLSKMVFLSEEGGEKHGCFVFPVYNGTGQIRHPYRLYYPGIHILSMEADGQPIPPQDCTIFFDEDLDMGTMKMKPGDCFAYIVEEWDDNELVFIRAVSESEEDHDLVKYVIPSFSILRIRYAVRDGVSGGTFYEGTATFAHRLSEDGTAGGDDRALRR